MTQSSKNEMQTYFEFKSETIPPFTFQIPVFKNWTIKQKTPTLIVYNPDESISIMFEVPPSIAIITEEIFNKNKHKELSDWSKNPQNAEYKRYFVKGFEQNMIYFKLKDKTTRILLPFNVKEHGLDSSIVEQKIIETLKFL